MGGTPLLPSEGSWKTLAVSTAVLVVSAHWGSQRNSKTTHLTSTFAGVDWTDSGVLSWGRAQSSLRLHGSRPWRQISKIASSQTKRQKVVSSPSPHPLAPTPALPREPSLQGPRETTLHLYARIFQWPVAQESWSCWFQAELRGQGQQTGACPSPCNCYIMSTPITATVCWETEWRSIKGNITQLSLHLALLFSCIAH